MLGKFLELSIATQDIRASLDFYAKLGFSQAQVGEAWPHPYAVVTDGRICLGLHQGSAFAPSTTFVKPDLLSHVNELQRLAPPFEFHRLSNDVFNEVGWLDPSGHLIRLIEARTFSPDERLPSRTSLCGYFIEIALPAPDRDAAKDHWEHFGFVGIDEPDAALPHVSCTSDTIDIGFYDPAHLNSPTLRFEVEDMGEALGRLRQCLSGPGGRVPLPLRHLPAEVLVAPEGTVILMTAAATA